MKPLISFATLLISLGLAQAGSVLEKTTTGTPEIGKINVISFAPEGVLLVGDGQNKQILAIETGDTEMVAGEFKAISDIQSEIGGRLGVPGKDIEILDFAINPASNRAYFALRKQDDKTYVILRLSPGNEMDLFSLENVKYARIPLPPGEKAQVNTVTDVVWAGDRLVAAGRCSEEFASKIFAADGPLEHDRPGQIYSAETFHVQHGRWETKAPMSVMIPFEEDGKHFIVGAFSCTPVVKYPIDAITPGAKIKGISMIELGSGNRPLDMFAYGDGEAAKVLTNTFRFHHSKRPYGPSPHLAFQFDQKLLGGEENVNEKATWRLKDQPGSKSIAIAEPFHGVVQMDRLGEKSALALKETNSEKVLSLVTIALP